MQLQKQASGGQLFLGQPDQTREDLNVADQILELAFLFQLNPAYQLKTSNKPLQRLVFWKPVFFWWYIIQTNSFFLVSHS